MGIFNVLGIMVFGIAVAVLVGLLLYKQYLGGRIETITEDLKKFEADFNQSNVDEWIRTAESIGVAKDVLEKHRRLSNVFSFLATSTVSGVRFSKFSFESSSNKVNLDTEARSYTALSQQREIFENNPAVEKIALSNFLLTPSGGVSASVELTLTPSFFLAR